MTDPKPMNPLLFLLSLAWTKAKNVGSTALGTLIVAFWCLMAFGFFARFLWWGAALGWHGADKVIAWTSSLFR